MPLAVACYAVYVGTRVWFGLLLVALACSGMIHALDVVLVRCAVPRPPSSMNSFLDLGVQTTFGVGLVVSPLQDAHSRLRNAERDRERLRRSLQRDESCACSEPSSPAWRTS